MGVGIYYFYHGFGLKAFEGCHIRMFIQQQQNQCIKKYRQRGVLIRLSCNKTCSSNLFVCLFV